MFASIMKCKQTMLIVALVTVGTSALSESDINGMNFVKLSKYGRENKFMFKGNGATAMRKELIQYLSQRGELDEDSAAASSAMAGMAIDDKPKPNKKRAPLAQRLNVQTSKSSVNRGKNPGNWTDIYAVKPGTPFRQMRQTVYANSEGMYALIWSAMPDHITNEGKGFFEVVWPKLQRLYP